MFLTHFRPTVKQLLKSHFHRKIHENIKIFTMMIRKSVLIIKYDTWNKFDDMSKQLRSLLESQNFEIFVVEISTSLVEYSTSPILAKSILKTKNQNFWFCIFLFQIVESFCCAHHFWHSKNCKSVKQKCLRPLLSERNAKDFLKF